MLGWTRRLRVRAILALGASLAVFAPARGRAEERIPLTLVDALARADRDSPDLASARDRAAAQGERAEGAGRSDWPRLTATSDWWRSDNPARVFAAKLNRGAFGADDFALDTLNHPDSLSHLVSALTLELPVDVFGKLGSRTDAERATARSFEARAEEAQQDVRLRVVEAFERAVLARAALRVGESALEGARSREADLGARVEQGAALHADWLRARTRRRQREAELAASREQWSVALAALARAVGAPPGTLFEPDASSSLPEAAATLAEWQQRAAGRGVMRAALERRAATEAAVAGEERSWLPDIGVYGQIQDDRGSSASSGSYAVGASLRWPLFDAGRSRRVAAAQAETRAAGNEERAAADQVRLEVEAAWRRLLSARERHAAAQGGTEDGREALRVVRERRQAGMATLTDELETETLALGAELEEISTGAELVIADAALRRAAGGL